MNFVAFLKSNLTMEKKDLRSEIELQFRYRLYMDPAFPFLISLGSNFPFVAHFLIVLLLTPNISATIC